MRRGPSSRATLEATSRRPDKGVRALPPALLLALLLPVLPGRAAAQEAATTETASRREDTAAVAGAAAQEDTAAAIAGGAARDTAATAGGSVQLPDESCITCHSVLDSDRLSAPVELYRGDVHAARGFGCVACHGGDGTLESPEAMDPEKGYIGAPDPQRIPEVCGRCHSNADFMRRYDPSIRVDQVAEYRTSVHGHLLLEQGDTLVATCADCHGAHAIRPPTDPASRVHPLSVPETCGGCHADPEYMSPYDIPTDQLESYRRSVHWEMVSDEGDLSAPVCNDCHGNHGAAPPGVAWVGNVCGQCHTVMADLFNASFHSEIFAMLGSPGCATCHDNHEIHRASDEMLGLEGDAVCGTCHSAEDTGGERAATMRTLVDSLSRQMERADSILTRAENAGMEVSQAQVNLQDAGSALIQARTAVHAFSVDSVEAKVDDGLEIAGNAFGEGREALEELGFRRLGLGVSAILIMILIAALVMKIREAGTGAAPKEETPP